MPEVHSEVVIAQLAKVRHAHHAVHHHNHTLTARAFEERARMAPAPEIRPEAADRAPSGTGGQSS